MSADNDFDDLPWPTLDQVEHEEDIEIQRIWMTHLPASSTPEEMMIMKRIGDRIRLLRVCGGPRIKLIPRH